MSAFTVSFVTTLLALAVGTLIWADARRRPARERADEMEAAGLRLAAAGEIDASGLTAFDRAFNERSARQIELLRAWDRAATVKGTVYASSASTAVEVVPVSPPVDVWMVKAVTVDPTLTDADVATAVEHVAPGVGSMTSFAAAVEDTRMRTSAELHELRQAELDAYAMASGEDDRLFFAGFARRMEQELTRFDRATARVDQWRAYQHQDNEHECVHCLRAVKETSDEHKLIRSLDDTGALSKVDIDAMYATHGATT